MTNVFIDGSAGTTGLRIYDRLKVREDISLITLPEEARKDVARRREALNDADIAFLCLPDDAAIEAVSLIESDHTKVIDTSTAHRVAEGWVYGFAELAGQREKISAGKRIANPGCHASGFIALVAPLVKAGLIDKDALVTCTSLTGYSGGGKKMIAQYEAVDRPEALDAPRQYGLSQRHKHIPEMKVISGLCAEPIFLPIVDNYYSGMEVTVPIFKAQMKGTIGDIRDVYKAVYSGPVVRYVDNKDEGGFLTANALAGRDDMEIQVFGNQERVLLTARFDNLGKGASGAAIQNMNLMMGAEETMGLEVNGNGENE